MQINNFSQFEALNEAQNTLRLNIPKDIIKLYKLFKKNGKELYVVGGAVRDALLKKKPKDFDLATNAQPMEVVKIITAAGYSTIGEVGQKFGVVIMQLPSDKDGVEIATFREDVANGRLPQSVNYTTIDKDVLRRDSTINALFYDIGKKEIVDLVGGLKDIQDKKVRTVGKPEDRFAEDPLRKLRALRFAGRTGSKFEQKTVDAILKDNNLNGVSPERIRDEFKKSIQTAKRVKDYLNLVSKFNMWGVMFPKLQINENFIETDLWLVQLALLFGNNDKDLIKKEMNRMSFSSDEVDSVVFLNDLLKFKPEDVFSYYKQLQAINLDKNSIIVFSKINRLDLKLIRAFLKYKPTTDGKEVMKKYDFKGAQIGEKIKELEAEKFKKSL